MGLTAGATAWLPVRIRDISRAGLGGRRGFSRRGRWESCLGMRVSSWAGHEVVGEGGEEGEEDGEGGGGEEGEEEPECAGEAGREAAGLAGFVTQHGGDDERAHDREDDEHGVDRVDRDDVAIGPREDERADDGSGEGEAPLPEVAGEEGEGVARGPDGGDLGALGAGPGRAGEAREVVAAEAGG